MLTRNHDYIMVGSKFPRLMRKEAGARLKEIKKLLLALQSNLQAINNPGFVEVVWRHLHPHAVADGQADKAFAHLARDVREHFVAVIELGPEHRPGQHRWAPALNFNCFFHRVYAEYGVN